MCIGREMSEEIRSKLEIQLTQLTGNVTDKRRSRIWNLESKKEWRRKRVTSLPSLAARSDGTSSSIDTDHRWRLVESRHHHEEETIEDDRERHLPTSSAHDHRDSTERKKERMNTSEEKRRDLVLLVGSQIIISCRETFGLDQSNRREKRNFCNSLVTVRLTARIRSRLPADSALNKARLICLRISLIRRRTCEEIKEVNEWTNELERDLRWRCSHQRPCPCHDRDTTMCCSPDEILIHTTHQSSSFLCHPV